jgi:hypothetical protein
LKEERKLTWRNHVTEKKMKEGGVKRK